MTKERLKYGPLRVGIGGPVGAGKTSMTEALCQAMGDDVSMAVITNDIYTSEDADYLVRAQALSSDRIRGVETGGCPHTAIREDASVNLSTDKRGRSCAVRGSLTLTLRSFQRASKVYNKNFQRHDSAKRLLHSYGIWSAHSCFDERSP